jgi:hypothetical protein
MNPSRPATPKVTQLLVDRICNEYLEMPGLRLTAQQARRLWGLDEKTCSQLLDYLVDVKFLARRNGDSYARVAEGAVARPRIAS